MERIVEERALRMEDAGEVERVVEGDADGKEVVRVGGEGRRKDSENGIFFCRLDFRVGINRLVEEGEEERGCLRSIKEG